MATKDITDLQVCQACEEMWGRRKAGENHVYPDHILQRVTGQPEKVCYRAMERAFGRGYLDYGLWLRGAWLTKKGQALLNPGSIGAPE